MCQQRRDRFGAVTNFAFLSIALAAMSGGPAAAQTSSSSLVVVTDDLDAPASATNTAMAASTKAAASSSTSIQKVVNGQFGVVVDNGWVLFQGFQNDATIAFYNTDENGNFNASGSLKIQTTAVGGPPTNGGPYVQAGGIVFTTVPTGFGKSEPSEGNVNGIGVGFGELSTGGAGGSEGGWSSDVNAKAQPTNSNFISGSTADLAIDPVNGAYEVGWDTLVNGVNPQGFIIQLDSSGQTFDPIARTSLGTLGGSSSQALGISTGATFVVGTADDGSGKARAVYAPVTGTGWTDLTQANGGFPATLPAALGCTGKCQIIKKSKALVATDNGWIAGNVVVDRDVVNRTNTPIEVGFVVNVLTGSPPVFFDVPGEQSASVVPLKVTSSGQVYGNLEFTTPKGTPAGTVDAIHPFAFDGTTVTDFGVMSMSGSPAYGCRANRPNNLGQMVGSCIASESDQYGAGGDAFFLDTTQAVPTFVDLNAAIHANEDSSVPALVPYALGVASSIDDEQEITLVGVKVVGGVANRASFLASQAAYQ